MMKIKWITTPPICKKHNFLSVLIEVRRDSVTDIFLDWKIPQPRLAT